MTLLHDLASRRELIYNLTVRELKIRYRGSVLGFLWTLLIPLFMAGIYIVFLRLLAGRDPHHITEAQYKAVARALREAVEPDPRITGVPSTKGAL